METDAEPFANVSAKLIACAVIIVCLLLGGLGLILPLLPGLLFLAIAAVVAAKLFPAFGDALRRSPAFRGYLDRAEGFVDLPFAEKAKLAVLLSVKMLLDGIAFVVAAVMKLIRAAERL